MIVLKLKFCQNFGFNRNSFFFFFYDGEKENKAISNDK